MNLGSVAIYRWKRDLASLDEEHNRILAGILNELPSVRCEDSSPVPDDLLRDRGGA